MPIGMEKQRDKAPEPLDWPESVEEQAADVH